MRLLWSAAASVTVAAVLAELCARLFIGNAAIAPMLLYNPGDGRYVGLRPNQRIQYTGWLLKIPAVEHDVNAFGFRGRPTPRERSAAMPRIAVIGDSFAYGIGVGAGDSIPGQLERLIAARGGRDVEVLNFGIPGLNAEEVLDQFEHFASAWDPDVVLYLVWSNDLDEGIRGGSMNILFKKEFSAQLVHASRFARLTYIAWAALMREEGERLIAPARFARLVHLAQAAVASDGDDKSLVGDAGAVDRFMQSVERLASAVKHKQARLRLVTLGWPVPESQRDQLRAALAAAEIPLLDVSSFASDPRNVIYMEGHLNADGCRGVAGTIARWLDSDENTRSALVPAAVR